MPLIGIVARKKILKTLIGENYELIELSSESIKNLKNIKFELWHLTAGESFLHRDYSNASHWLLNLNTADWDAEMLTLFESPVRRYRKFAPPVDCLATPKGGRHPGGYPVLAMIGDSHAALFAHGLGAAGWRSDLRREVIGNRSGRSLRSV